MSDIIALFSLVHLALYALPSINIVLSRECRVKYRTSIVFWCARAYINYGPCFRECSASAMKKLTNDAKVRGGGGLGRHHATAEQPWVSNWLFNYLLLVVLIAYSLQNWAYSCSTVLFVFCFLFFTFCFFSPLQSFYQFIFSYFLLRISCFFRRLIFYLRRYKTKNRIRSKKTRCKK